jgi:putative transposase
MNKTKKYRLNYNSSRNCVYNINFHIIWTTKYRKKLLSSEIHLFLKKILYDKCEILDVLIKAFEIMPDHIHLFISTKLNINLIKTINILKGFSSFITRKQFPELKKIKSLWTSSYFCESIGYIGEKNIIKYINNQKY